MQFDPADLIGRINRRIDKLKSVRDLLLSLDEESVEILRLALERNSEDSEDAEDAPLEPETPSDTYDALVARPYKGLVTGRLHYSRYARGEIENALMANWARALPSEPFDIHTCFRWLIEDQFRFKGPDKKYTLRAISRVLKILAEKGSLRIMRPNSGRKPALYRLDPDLVQLFPEGQIPQVPQSGGKGAPGD